MDNRRDYPRIIVLNLGINFRSQAGEDFAVVNASDGGLCLRRNKAPKVSPGHPLQGVLSWPEKNITKDLSGMICWSRQVEDGDTFYGVHLDVTWLMDMVGEGEGIDPGDSHS